MTIAVVAVAESAVRAFDNRLDEPLEWYHGSAQNNHAEMDRLADGGLTSDLTFIGTSMVIAGVVTETFEARLVTVVNAHNVALPAGQTTVMKRWVLEEVLPELQPAKVVWGVSTLDFNGNRAELPIDAYDQARATRTGALGVTDRLLDLLALSHYREKLRDFSVFEDLQTPDSQRSLPNLADALAGRRRSDDSEAKRAAQLKRIEKSVLNDYTTGEGEIEAFRTTIDVLLRSGVEVVVVFMPIPSSYIDAHPRGAVDVEDFKDAVSDVARSLKVEVMDMSLSVADNYFADNTHLNAEGAELFSNDLAVRLARLGW